jgi:uncharacterized protein (TIGR00299 family) protein
METIAYFDCFSGISGDMTLGALLDLGVPEDHIRDGLRRLPVGGYSLRISRQTRGAIQGTRVEVAVESAHQHDRTFAEIRDMLERADLPPSVLGRALAVFRCLAEAEGRVHGVSADEVHFHEIGAVDSIVDIVGTALAAEYLRICRAYVSALPLGSGFVRCSHGLLPVPAPATLELLRDMRTVPTRIEGELVTPTGAAIVRALAGPGSQEPPPLRVRGVGYGVGSAELEYPNLLRIILGEADPAYGADEVVEIECTIDDANPQLYEHVMERLFARGALDVYLVPVQMKKGRPGVSLHVLAEPWSHKHLCDIVFEETTTIGIRVRPVQRVKLDRRDQTVETPYGPVRVKVVRTRGASVEEYRPEYEDCRQIALREGIPLRTVYETLNSFLLGCGKGPSA